MPTVHILHADSITPIARYLDRSRAAPGSYAAQTELAALILYREREYRNMHQPNVLRGPMPIPRADSPFAPFDITEAGSRFLLQLLPPFPMEASPVFDLFGLKPTAIDRLGAALRRTKSHGLGWLLLARLLDDCDRLDEAAAANASAAALGESTDRRRLDDRIERLARRVRAREEGEAFARFCRPESEFCAAERARAQEGFDESRVPEPLRGLIDAARTFGVGDDACREVFLRALTRAQRAELKGRVLDASAVIDAWIDSEGQPPYRVEATAFFWLRYAAEEL